MSNNEFAVMIAFDWIKTRPMVEKINHVVSAQCVLVVLSINMQFIIVLITFF